MTSEEKKLLQKMIDKIDVLSKAVLEAYVDDCDGLETMIPSRTILEMEAFMGNRITLMGMS